MNPFLLNCSLAVLPGQFRSILHTRLAYTTSSSLSGRAQYVYPTHPRPTPYQIFHLPPGASQQDIKLRYYDLVRLYHPDSAHSRSLPVAERHSRFQAITAAYDVLRAKNSTETTFNQYGDELRRRRKTYYTYHYPRAEHLHTRRAGWTASADDRWKDRVILIVGLMTLAAGLAPGLFILPLQLDKRHRAAAYNLTQARKEARELGIERRNERQKRVQDMNRGDPNPP